MAIQLFQNTLRIWIQSSADHTRFSPVNQLTSGAQPLTSHTPPCHRPTVLPPTESICYTAECWLNSDVISACYHVSACLYISFYCTRQALQHTHFIYHINSNSWACGENHVKLTAKTQFTQGLLPGILLHRILKQTVIRSNLFIRCIR